MKRLSCIVSTGRRGTAKNPSLLETSIEVERATDLESAALTNEHASGITEFLEPVNYTSLKESDDKGQNDTLNSEIARRFLQIDSKRFEQLGRYETALWRQASQVIFVLNVLRCQNLDRSWLPRSSSSTRARFRPLGSLLPKA